jgi:hypothetical protein
MEDFTKRLETRQGQNSGELPENEEGSAAEPYPARGPDVANLSPGRHNQIEAAGFVDIAHRSAAPG